MLKYHVRMLFSPKVVANAEILGRGYCLITLSEKPSNGRLKETPTIIQANRKGA